MEARILKLAASFENVNQADMRAIRLAVIQPALQFASTAPHL
jgi:hypothetical protein